MAKKTAVKKPRRRLKKTVRRSMAVVLMITAIVVAAIPVPENLAVTPGRSSREATTQIAYHEATYDDLLDNEPGKHGVQNETGCSNTPLNSDGSLPSGLEALIANGNLNPDAPSNEKLKASIKLGSIDGDLTLGWEFLYHPKQGSGRAKLCKYNNEFPEGTVTLDLVPVKDYHTVELAQYSAYYSENPSTYNPDFPFSKNEMDNLNPSGKLYPANQVRYTYDHWTGRDLLTTAEKQFLTDYFGQEVEETESRFEAYDDWLQHHEDDEPEPAHPDLVKTPRLDLSPAQKIKFYLQHNIYAKANINITDETTFVKVTDERLGENGARRSGETLEVYVIKGEASGMGVATTENGYVVEKDSENKITAIGERAFQEVTTVTSIKIPDVIKIIGDEAFLRSGIIEVEINNEAVIGNKAFYRCSQLTTVTLGNGVTEIGAEAFRGCNALRAISFPYTISKVGHGAFSGCGELASVNLSSVDQCQLMDYAFYDDTALANINFGDSAQRGVNYLGEFCFAVTNPSTGLPLQNFAFPKGITGTLGLDGTGGEMEDYVLANRQSLSVVTMPDNYREPIPKNTFCNCTELRNVIFPDTCQEATFDENLFESVTNSEFFVRGPELFGNGPAEPRRCTWYAYTRVSGESGIPYVFKRGNVECYEVAMRSDDGSLYRYEANAEGELLSCVLINGRGSVDVIIPSKVGSYNIKSIAEGCFSDETLRNSINSITIQNHSISRIDSRAFQGLENLKKVRIGDSVTEIGDDAFADCKSLTDVFFTKPAGGYKALTMADSSFATRGAKLTFHGDIDKDFRPFTWAMEKDRTLKDPNNATAPDVNVCYQSLWDSETGTHLTVMRDRTSDDVVLLDYPKLTDLRAENIRNDVELDEYCKEMERTYYYDVYGNDNAISIAKNMTVGELRREYAKLLKEKEEDDTANIDERIKAYDGPWINPNFCNVRSDGTAMWRSYLPQEAEGGETSDAGQSLYDFFFEPLVAEAAEGHGVSYWLKPYFEREPYNFIENYERQTGDDEQLDLYQEVDERAMRFINGAKTIIVPDGVTSIDVTNYAKSNNYNYKTYITNRDNQKRDTDSLYDRVPGLFSGYYQDYLDGNAEGRETDPRGNDVVERIVLTSVTKLPDYAFDNCELLESVTLGAVKEMGPLPFRGCRNMTSIIGNENYPAEKGILYETQDGDPRTYKIVECLMSKGNTQNSDEGMQENEVSLGLNTLLKDVTSIAEHAFDGCEYLSRVNLTGADGIKEIPEGCFKDCKSLTHVELPVSINKIKENSFEGVTSEGTGGRSVEVVIRGREVDIADSSFVPKDNVTIFSYADSAAERFAKRHNITFKTLDSYRVKFYDYDGKQIGKTQELARVADEELFAKEPEEAQLLRAADHRPGYKFNGEWYRYTSDGQIKTLRDPIEEDMTTFVAQYDTDGSMVGGKFVVEFHDGVDGSMLSGRGSDEKDGKYYVDAGMTFKDKGWPVPTHKTQAGYEALGYSDNFSETTVIDKNMSIVLLYKVASGGNSGNTSGGSTNTSGGTTSGNSGNTSGSSSNTSSSSSSSNSSSSTSTSSTSATSGTSGAGQYTVFVENGSGSGTYTPGTTVIIQASIPAAGMRFDKWTTESNGVTLASVSMSATTFTMPSNNVTVKANYVADNTAALTGTTGTGNTTNTTGNGNTRVDIEKPGISNRDLATATTNGSTDNFIVKISETDEATRAVAAALTNKYGTLDNILYYAMDISLYDSTGTTKITNTTGLSVDITIPIPDSLVAYGGNNMAGAVINGDQLESLNESFTTINGVPCIRFRATHFSPYTIYVDTGNLVEGMLDVTPKTGDPIHPKWFLSLGLACLSMILFLKRDKKVAVRA